MTFDDSASFLVDIDTAEVAITPASMTALMNSYVLAYEGSPIKNMTVEIRGNRLIQKGTVHKGVDLPFEMEGSMSATADGEIRVHAEKIKAGHLPLKGLLHLFGEDLSKLINSNASRGMKVEGDDILLSPRALTPPPHMEGRVIRAGIEGGKIVQHFDSGRHLAALKPSLPVGGIHLSPQRHPPLRKAHDERRRPPDRRRPRGSLRVLPARISEAARRRLFEEHSGRRTGRAHGRLYAGPLSRRAASIAPAANG